MSEEKAKGIYHNPEKAAIYRELMIAVMEQTEANAVGDDDLAREKGKIVKDLYTQLKAGGRGSGNLLDKEPREVLDMKPARGEALVIVKTCAGTECRKLAIKEDIIHRRINVSFANIWAYPEVETEKPKVELAKNPAKVTK